VQVSETDPVVVVVPGSTLQLGHFIAHTPSAYLARLPGDPPGLEGLGFTPEEAIADLRDFRRWLDDRDREAQAASGERFARSLESLLRMIGKSGWQVARQQSAFDSEAGGEVKMTLTWNP
jgi:hypothetical protein